MLPRGIAGVNSRGGIDCLSRVSYYWPRHMTDFSIAGYVSRVEINRTVKDSLMKGLLSTRPRRRVSVTDLLSLKQAYFRRKHPEVVPSLERQQVMWSGTGFHDLFGAAVSREEYLEQFVEFEGVVGKIDIFEDIPVEVKTTARLSEEADLLRQRPSYIEQLGMYCAMAGLSEGRVVVYQRGPSPDGGLPLSVSRVRFSDIDGIKAEIRRRRDMLEQALAAEDPSALPACHWGNRGCDYSAVCDCKTSRAGASKAILDRTVSVEPDGEALRGFLAKLSRPARPGRTIRLNDIVFPRKAYFARKHREDLADEESAQAEQRDQLSSMSRWGVVDALRDCLKYGGEGVSQRAPVRAGALFDMVQLYHGKPTITRVSQLRSIVERGRIAQVSPHYALRLAFECALSGQPQGSLLMYYQNVPRDDARLIVYDLGFREMDRLRDEAVRRIGLLESGAAPEQLPACPVWMARACKYSPDCGCGRDQSGEAQRRLC